MKAFAAAAAALLVSGACAHAPAPAQPTSSIQSISYETTPCFGICPVYRFTVQSNGRGRFEGRAHTPVTGERDFRVRPDQFDAFARHLERIRPDAGNWRIEGETCPEVEFTDHPTVEVTWRHGGGEVQQLRYYYGCAPEHYRALAETLGTAPFLLPIGELIGSR